MQPSTLPQVEIQPVGVLPGPVLIDSHAHLHFDSFAGQVPALLHRATEAGVTKVVTVGVNTADSRKAAELAAQYENVWATVGIHPHDAGEAESGIGYLRELASRRKVVAVGECGLDAFRSKTSPEEQERALRLQIEVALEVGQPLAFHVREAFADFWRILDDYPGVRGVVHSFTGTRAEMETAVERGLYVALNGIMTFTEDAAQLEAARQLPLGRMILETDCPFLSPAPHRGKTNEPARVSDIAQFLAELRGEALEDLATATTANSQELFKLS